MFDRSGVEPALNLEMLTGNQITGKPFLGYAASDTPLSWRAGIDFVTNALIFIPLGWLSHAAWAGRYPDSGKGALFVALYFIETRHSSILDVVANTAEMGIGIVLNRCIPFLVCSREMLLRWRGA